MASTLRLTEDDKVSTMAHVNKKIVGHLDIISLDYFMYFVKDLKNIDELTLLQTYN